MDKKISYPVIAIKKKVLFPMRDKADLYSCNNIAFKKGWFKNLKFVDSDGYLFTVKSAEKIKNNFFLAIIRSIVNPKFPVDLIFTKNVEKVSLENCKKMIIRTIEADKYFWESGGNYDEIIDEITNALHIHELISRFTFDFYKEYKV